jgi:hypothetical protein
VQNFFLTLDELSIFVLFIDLVVYDSVGNAYYSPPEHITRLLIKLFREFISDGTATFAVESTTVVVGKQNPLLSFQLFSFHRSNHLVVCFVTGPFTTKLKLVIFIQRVFFVIFGFVHISIDTSVNFFFIAGIS